MNITKVWGVYFSPTGGTKKVVISIAEKIAASLQKEVVKIDYTKLENRGNTYQFGKDDLVVLGTPVYAGRIPNKILPDIEHGFHGTGTPLIPVSVYGNRSFDDALMELKLVLEKQGFHTFAAAAIVSQHAFSHHLSAGRPDQDDRQEISAFSERIAKRLLKTDTFPTITVTGNNPVKNYYTPLKEDGTPAKFLKAKPVTDMNTCDGCGLCARLCPMGSIDSSDYSLVPGICIKCHACVRRCPQHAKRFVDEEFLSHVRMLEEHYDRRSDNYFFEK